MDETKDYAKLMDDRKAVTADMQDMIDTAFDQAGEDSRAFFWFLLGELEEAFKVHGPSPTDFD